MIVNASAVLAILQDEPQGANCLLAVGSSESIIRMSAANYVEAAIVIDSNRDPIASRRLDEFVRKSGMEIEPVTEAQAQIARQAYRDFGRGSGHPARLNFGDCFAYALAK
jgi:ribonuclease VapC